MEIKINAKVNRRNLGLGMYGPIVKGTVGDVKVAVKKIPLQELSGNFSKIESALKQMNHEHVIKLIAVDQDEKCRYFAFQQCKNSLDQLIYSESRFRTPRYKILSCRKMNYMRLKALKETQPIVEANKPFIQPRKNLTMFIDRQDAIDADSFKQIKRCQSILPMPTDENILLQLAKGLDYIHRQGIVNGCIKPENVLIDDGPPVQFKWADFGLSKLTIPNQELPLVIRLASHTGMWTWMAPELLKKIHSMESKNPNQQFPSPRSLGATIASDIFSAGCLFFYIITRGTHPFGDLTNAPMNIIRMEAVKSEELPHEHFSKELIDNMILENSESRICLERAIEILSILANRREREIQFLELCKNSEVEDSLLALLEEYVSSGVDLNCVDDHGRTPLMMLYMEDNGKSRLRCTEIILGAKRTRKDASVSPNPRSPGPCAQRLRRSKDIHLSRDRSLSPEKLIHVDLNCYDNDGRNALMYLVRGEKRENILETVKLLLRSGININDKDENGNNVLMYLCSSYRGSNIVELAQTLIQYGLDINHENLAGDSAIYFLMASADESHLHLVEAMMKLLVSEGVDVNHENKSGQNVLLKLLWDSHPSVSVVKLLIQFGVRIDHQPKQGWNAMFYFEKDYSTDEIQDILSTAENVLNYKS